MFPVTGHSFIPPDRVFGNIEKKIKCCETIIDPDEYRTIISEHGTVINLGTDCVVADFKTAAETVFKSTNSLHFKISECKRFFLRKNARNNDIQVRGEPVYKHDMNKFEVLTKKNRNMETFCPKVIPKYKVKVKEEKAIDVKKLLQKHFGSEWEKNEQLKFFKKNFERGNVASDAEEENDLCGPVQDFPELVM